jgi:hypothetical protein
MIAAETGTTEPVLKLHAETPTTPSPAELIATRCLICHGNPAAGAKRLAPPFRMVKMHYDDLDEAAFVKTVSAWVKQPDHAKSRMPGAIRNFGLMPALVLPEAEITAIATYLYRTDFPMPGQGGGMGRGPRAMTAGRKPATDAKSCLDGCRGSCGGSNQTTTPESGGDCGTETKDAPDSCVDPQQKGEPKAPDIRR